MVACSKHRNPGLSAERTRLVAAACLLSAFGAGLARTEEQKNPAIMFSWSCSKREVTPESGRVASHLPKSACIFRVG